MQARFPEGPDSLTVPLPDAFERWRDLYLHSGFQKFLVFAAVALTLYAILRIARRQINRQIDDVNRRHILRKWIGYGYIVLIITFGAALFADFLSGLGTVLAVLFAGIAIALQDVLKSIVGWLYLSSRSGIEVGSRVEVNGITGDVIDIGVLKTTMLEIGNLVFGRQATGRLVTVPNYMMLADSVLFSGIDNPFVWQEIQVTVTYESDWERAEAIMRTAAEEMHAEIAPELDQGFRRLERRYAFKYGALTPIVYVTMGPSGVELTLRYLIHVRRWRGSEDRVSRQVLTALRREPGISIAYTAYRLHRVDGSAAGSGAMRGAGPQDLPGG